MIKLKDLLSEAPKIKAIDVTYIEVNGKLYKILVDGKRIYVDDFEKQFSIELPSRYDDRKLDKIAKEFKKSRIKFTHNDTMDVS